MSTDDLTTWDKQLLGEAGVVWTMSSALLSANILMTKLLESLLAGDVDTVTQLSAGATQAMLAEQSQIGERRQIISRVLAKMDVQMPHIDTPSTTPIDWDDILQNIAGTD